MINPQNERLQIDAPIAFVCTFFIFHPRTPKTIIICLHYTYTTSCVYEYIKRIFSSNQIIHKISFSLCFWASDHLIDKFN